MAQSSTDMQIQSINQVAVQVVVYDDTGGAHAVRLWWMLRWLGHDAVAVMDGGWPRWIQEGRQVTAALTVS